MQPVLGDASNLQEQQQHEIDPTGIGRAAKRQRLEALDPAAASFATIVARAGIQGLSTADNADADTLLTTTNAAAPSVDDPRKVKRQLNADLATKSAAQDTFVSSMGEVVGADELLRCCLLPMEVTNPECLRYATGDSFMRMLLNILPLQQRLATLLLQKLPEFSSAECDEGGGGPDGAAAVGDSSTASLASLILAQLRWLEVVADAPALTASMLEVLPVCSPSIQRQLIGILPEVAQLQDHPTVLEQLQGLLESDITFMAPVVECLGNMMLEPAAQDEVVLALLAQLPAVEVEDLPGLVKYVVGAARSTNAEQVLSTLRASLHFVNPTDPRLAVPDRRQKGPMHPTARAPEALLVRELVGALQGNTAAATACLKLQDNMQDPASHGVFDLVVLLALHAKGADSRRAVEGCFKKQLTEGGATPAWLARALSGHQACYRDQLWGSLLSLANSWSAAREAPVSAAASGLYVALFVAFEGPLERQQVLHALHGHLGSGVSAQQDVALKALLSLSGTKHVDLLRGYNSYLANILDHLEGFSNSQLQQVFGMFAALTARQPAAAAAAAAGGAGASSSAAAGSSSAAAAAGGGGGGGGGSRLEDELVITLNKALAQANPGYKRIGIMGMLALLQQEGATYDLMCDADGRAADAVKESWIGRADSVFNQCMSHPGVFAFLLDQWALLLETQQQQHGQQQAGGGAGDVVGAAPVPEPMLDWMQDKINDLLVEVFTAEMPQDDIQESEGQELPFQQQQQQEHDIAVDDPHIKAQLWFNLDGDFTPVYLAVMPLAASKDMAKRTQLTWLPAALRLLAAIARCRSGDLTHIDALLGCPVALPDRKMFTDGRWDTLPLASKVCVLSALQHSVCWLRESVAVFAPCISAEVLVATAGTENTQATMNDLVQIQNKLLMRVVELRATEALFCDLASSCPAAAQQLQDLSYPLLTAASGRASGGASSGAGAAAGSSQALSLCRCLRPPAAIALNAFQPPNLLHTTLLPATHLSADLHAKLKLLLARTRRPAGLMAPPAAQAPTAAAGGSAGLLFPAVLAPSGPPCMEGVELQRFVQQVVLPLLPALQQHMVLALNVVKQPLEGGLGTLFNGLPGYGTPAETAMYELSAVQPVVQPTPAAHQLALCCLQCFTLLLGCSKELPPAMLQAVLTALGLQQQAEAGAATAAPSKQQVHEGLRLAFKACRKLSCRASGNSTLQLELAVLSLLQALHSLAADQGVGPDRQALMATKLSQAAAELLQEDWQGGAAEDEAAEGDSSKAFSWKGQTAAITQLLSVLVTKSTDPSSELSSLVTDALGPMPDKVPSKEQLDPVAGFAALCSATFQTWYKVIFEQLVAHWERVNARALSLLTGASTGQGTTAAAAGGGGGSRGGGGQGAKKRHQQQPQLQYNSEGEPDWDAEQVDEVVEQAQRCAQCFASLVELTRKHKTRNQLLGTALKNGGAFIDVLVKNVCFWQAYYTAYGKPFQSLLKTVQKGTKIMQAICVEGKVRGGASVVAQAPAAKRALERFVHEIHSLFLCAGEPPEAITVGFLKHRDIEGNAMPSQLFPEPEDEEEEEEEEEDGAEDEDMGDGEGSTAAG